MLKHLPLRYLCYTFKNYFHYLRLRLNLEAIFIQGFAISVEGKEI